MAEETWQEWLNRKLRDAKAGAAEGLRQTRIPIPFFPGNVSVPAKDVPAVAREIARRAPQVAAGALEVTVANSARKGKLQARPRYVRRDDPLANKPMTRTAKRSGDVHVAGYRPAILDQPGAVIGLVQTLANLARGEQNPMPGEDSWTGRSLDRARTASENANQLVGTDYPQDWLDTVLRVGGALAIPGPKLPRVAATAPASVRVPVNAAVTAAEVALPLRQGGGKALGAGVGFGTGVSEVLDTVAPDIMSNRVTGAPYTSITDTLSGRENEGTSSLDELMAAPPSVEELGMAMADEQEPDIDDLMSQPLEEAELDAAEEAQKEEEWSNAEIALVAGLGALASAPIARRVISSRLHATANGDIPSFIGKRVRRSRGGRTSRFVTAVAEQSRPIYNAAEDFLSPIQAANIRYKGDLINNVSIGSRVAHQFRTGRMVGVSSRANGQPRRTVPLAPLAQAYAKELSLDEQRLVGDALLASSALDDFKRTGTLAALNTDKFGADMTPAKLQSFVAQVEGNPKYAKYMQGVRQSFADILEYRVARGTMSREAADEFRRLRPNYVKMTRDLDTDAASPEARPYNANTDKGLGQTRGTEEASGVQGGAVGNPFNVLFDDWASEIRRAEVNDIRALFLEQVDTIGGGRNVRGARLVHRLPDGVKPNTQEGVHTVWQNGKTVSYKVNDPVLSQTLEFAPRATIQALEQLRQISQSVTTGPIGTLFNAFAVAKSTLYDTTLGSLLRPKDVNLGLINETLSRLNVNPPQAVSSALSRLDPTTYVSAFTGAARYMWDDLRGAMAQNLTDQLIRDNTWLRSAIGDKTARALRDRLAASYEASVKSIMDEHGITSMTMHGSPDPTQVLTNMGDIAPAFDNAAVMQRLREEGLSLIDGARGTSAYLGLRNTTIRRAYTGVLEAMHNGFRYSATAANVKRNPNMEKLASQMRRLSADSAQHGGSDALNKTMSGFMYANLSVQTLHQTARAIKANPVSFLGNLGALGMVAAALHYTSLASDPAAQEKHKNKTAAQKAASITTFGGAEIPVDPLLRIPLSSVFAVLDHATGASTGQWDGNMLAALNNVISGDFAGEEYFEDAATVLYESARANNPLAAEANPITGAVQAYSGIDPGMTRMSGDLSEIRTQQMSGFDPEKGQIDGLSSAYAENMIGTLFGSAGDSLWRMANDASRAWGDTDDLGVALDVGLSRYRDTLARSSGVFKPVLFGNYEQTYAVTDTNWQLMRAREQGIEQAAAINNRDIKAEGITGSGKQALPLPSDQQTTSPELAGTKLDVIAAHAGRLKTDLSYFKQQLSALGKQAEATRGFYTTPIEERNRQVNEINEKRKYLTMQMLVLTRRVEGMVQQQIGDPDFRFDDFDPERYLETVQR